MAMVRSDPRDACLWRPVVIGRDIWRRSLPKRYDADPQSTALTLRPDIEAAARRLDSRRHKLVDRHLEALPRVLLPSETVAFVAEVEGMGSHLVAVTDQALVVIYAVAGQSPDAERHELTDLEDIKWGVDGRRIRVRIGTRSEPVIVFVRELTEVDALRAVL